MTWEEDRQIILFKQQTKLNRNEPSTGYDSLKKEYQIPLFRTANTMYVNTVYEQISIEGDLKILISFDLKFFQ